MEQKRTYQGLLLEYFIYFLLLTVQLLTMGAPKNLQ